ncbi:hypothetical protein [Aurantiacibacter gangjinensis]|uniref:Uncharacterized protein n=1 Tax=Aurantiacibacter gangjinensis TaxID=502682 RepID=A0A0G9MM75_9SPHN|nr:hypothetical protein [Aurantiacibacter gangjinensis]APE27801.1 hypothetical protein BMF35_a0972 [Aurantiacibacter gangjinensis]KLE31790.1 hypothetical protein AAW01_09835 [Aurantiacibacter gangjinensis]
MKRSLVASLSLLAAAACTPSPTPDSTQQASARPADRASVAGDWDVVSFDGYTVPYRMRGTNRAAYANFREREVSLHLECNWSGVVGRMRGDRFVPADSGPRIMTVAGCEAPKHERDEAYFSFFDDEPTGQLLPDGRLLFEAGGIELLLQRPEDRHLDFVPYLADLQGEWRMETLTMYQPEGGMSSMGLMEVPGRIVFDGNRAGYSRCPAYDITFDYTPDGTIANTGGVSLPEEPTACEGLAERSYGNMSPERWDVLTLLHENPQAEHLANGDILLFNERFGLLLTRQPCVMLNQSDDHSRTWEENCASPR